MYKIQILSKWSAQNSDYFYAIQKTIQSLLSQIQENSFSQTQNTYSIKIECSLLRLLLCYLGGRTAIIERYKRKSIFSDAKHKFFQNGVLKIASFFLCNIEGCATFIERYRRKSLFPSAKHKFRKNGVLKIVTFFMIFKKSCCLY